jgi:hypothetical protein
MNGMPLMVVARNLGHIEGRTVYRPGLAKLIERAGIEAEMPFKVRRPIQDRMKTLQVCRVLATRRQNLVWHLRRLVAN